MGARAELDQLPRYAHRVPGKGDDDSPDNSDSEDGDDPDEDPTVKHSRWYRDVLLILRCKMPLI